MQERIPIGSDDEDEGLQTLANHRANRVTVDDFDEPAPASTGMLLLCICLLDIYCSAFHNPKSSLIDIGGEWSIL